MPNSLHQDKDLPLRRTLCASLADIAKHTPELGAKVAESGVLPHVAAFLDVWQPDTKLKAEVMKLDVVFEFRFFELHASPRSNGSEINYSRS